jgi:hypothetical protein
MRGVVLSFLIGWVLLGAEARSQFSGRMPIVGPGSTPQGDYLRGLGIAASGFGNLYAGAGMYNLDTARAESIQADTAIRVDSYLSMVFRAGRDNWQLIDRQTQEKLKRNYDAIKKRIRDTPEEVDVMTGNALNSVLEEINNPQIQPSSFRSIKVMVPIEMVRKIPFKLDEKGVIFSRERLTPKGKKQWPVAFQDDKYNKERLAFEHAVDAALELMIEGKMTEAAIDNYKFAVESLSNKLDREYGVSRDRRYNEAKTRLAELARTSEILKTFKMQRILADIEKYGGTTVDDLRLFMQKFNLRFAMADSPEERKLFPELYARMVEVRDVVKVPTRERDR